MNVEELDKFYPAQLTYILNADPDARTLADGEPLDAYQTELHNMWLEHIGGLKAFDAMPLDNCLSSFQLWLVENYLNKTKPHREYIEVFVQRSWGAVTAGVKLGGTMDITTAASRSASYDYLWAAAHDELIRYEKNHLANTPANAPSGAGHSGNPGDIYQDMICERISVEVKDGKRLYKIHGGKWSKHGVRVWPEVILLMGLDPESIPTEGLKLKARNCRVRMTDNNTPQKVVSISTPL